MSLELAVIVYVVTGEVLKKASLNFTFRWQSNIPQGIQ